MDHSFSKQLLLCFVTLLLLSTACDTLSSTQETDLTKENTEPTASDFFAYRDSTNQLLVTAVDSLQRFHQKFPFAQRFIKERGYPAWDKGSAFYSNQQPVLLIPVTRPVEQRVTGLVYISVVDGAPFYRWIPRGIQTDLEGYPGKQSLETLILGHEHRLFGKEQNAEIRIREKQYATSRIKKGASNTLSSSSQPTTVWIEIAYTTCYGVDAGDNGHTDWECETTYEWTSVQVGGSDGSGSDGSGSGGGPGGGGNNGGSGGNGDDGPPDPVPPIPGDAQNEPFSIGIGVDTERLDEFPKLKCVVDKVLDTSNMQDLIAEFGMAYTSFDLIFSGSPDLVDSEDTPILGELDHFENDDGRDQFIVLANNNMAQDRSSVEVAITYLHETMHAEMRRYLLDNADTSTLPNFPGSITEDWTNFVAERNKPDAEHQAMGYEEYIALVAKAASDFDNGRMPLSYYKALAWEGIWEYSDFWGNLSQSEKNIVSNNYSKAQEELENRNSDYCN